VKSRSLAALGMRWVRLVRGSKGFVVAVRAKSGAMKAELRRVAEMALGTLSFGR
jgi:hypothetical protein